MIIQTERALLEILIARRLLAIKDVSARLKPVLDQLCMGRTIRIGVPNGKRSLHIEALRADQLQIRLAALSAPALAEAACERARNIHEAQDSKKGERLPYAFLSVLGSELVQWQCPDSDGPVFLTAPVHGYCTLVINDKKPGTWWQPLGPVVFVENREAWLSLSERLPEALKGAAVVLYEGWMSKRLIEHLKRWSTAEIYLFADLDPVGFSNLKALNEAGVKARMLLPEMTQHLLKTCGNASVWASNTGLINGVSQWIAKSFAEERDAWSLLCEHGVAIEQEVILGLNELKWLSTSGQIVL